MTSTGQSCAYSEARALILLDLSVSAQLQGRAASFREYQLNPQTEKARDHYYHDYDADDVEDVHCQLPVK